jgi:arsenate reductase (thioredoxin)
LADKPWNVLFICTSNSARSIMAEALLNHLAGGRFKAWSAGSHPKGSVSAPALRVLGNWGIPVEGLRSKSWDEFAQTDSPHLDFVFTVCDRAAGEMCPVWPGQPMTAHWGVADPSAAGDSPEVQARSYHDAALVLKRRIELMLALPIERLARMRLQEELDRIGRQ